MRFSLTSLLRLNHGTITLLVVFLVVVLFLIGVPFLDLIELKTYDLRYVSRGPKTPGDAVVLAVIDEKSLDTGGRWPWPRAKIAELVEVLSREGAAVIGFDIGFLEPDENSRLGFIEELGRRAEALDIGNTKLADFIAESRRLADNDRILAEAIRKASPDVILGYFFHMSEGDLDYRLAPDEIEQRLRRIADAQHPMVMFDHPARQTAPFLRAYAPESNLQTLAEAADGSGYFSVVSDPDGVVRWMPLMIQCGEDLYLPLSLASVWHYLGKPPMMVQVKGYGVEGIQLADRFVPTDESGRMLINYLGPPKTFPYYSISEILASKTPAGIFKGRIVLVGASAVGTHDLRSTPFSPLYPGVEIHATVIDNILKQEFITKPRWSIVFDLMAIVGLGVLSGIAAARLGTAKGFVIAAAAFVLYIVFARWLFINSRVWLNLVYPLLALSLNYTGLSVYGYVTEQRERRRIKGAFKHYVSPEVIEEMLKDPDRLKLGGEEKVLTVLFSDLEGFTTHSEQYAPGQMIDILSEYYENMTEEIFAHQGMLKEYVGDELMAIFGAPLEQKDHAHKACAAALAMRKRRKSLGLEWAASGRPVLKARTGVNSGPMLVGNLGSRYRFSYGVLGDQVNLGSRLEGLNKVYRTEILIGENTARLVDGAYRLREVDMVRVKGRTQPVRIYELLTEASELLPTSQEQGLQAYAAGLAAYWSRHWNEALDRFHKTLELLPNDGPSLALVERCHIYRQNQPPEDWDGVFTLKTK
jgi:adenylate cyclase